MLYWRTMCYSAMVEQNAKKLGLRFKARVQTELYGELFQRRLTGESLLLNKAMEYPFTHAPRGPEEERIGADVRAWHQARIAELERALFMQKKRLADAERALVERPTKKAEDEKRVAANKITKCMEDLNRHRSQEIVGETEERIFPLHYMSMLCLDDDEHLVVRPVRYLLRPRDKDEAFDRKFGGCYNARLDSLDKVAWWRNLLGRRHGLILARRFYENVPTERYLQKHTLPAGESERKSLVISFSPDNMEYMFIPTLWDKWEAKHKPALYSAALITDEPAPEIAEAGHDRTPIFLQAAAIEDWLRAKGRSVAELKVVLDRRERPHYSHQVLGVA